MWRVLRIALLCVLLFLAAAGTVLDRWRTTDWQDTLTIGLFPIDADGQPATRAYLQGLATAQFASIEGFFAREARRHGIALTRPVQVLLHPPVTDLPPRLDAGAGPLATALWSLRMRWYAAREAGGKAGQIRVFVLYHDPRLTPRVPHSLGLQKGLIGVVYAFAEPDMDGANNIVIAHEIMHTLGATDRYDPATGLPVFPAGYGDPARQPRYPQPTAEIMAGRRALSSSEARMPRDLERVVVGPETAAEIAWAQ